MPRPVCRRLPCTTVFAFCIQPFTFLILRDYSRYETVIGLEIHLQLSTQSKAFCGDAIRFGADPNTQVSPVSLGLPGVLPRLNERQVEYAVRLGLALGSEINLRNTFDRKNYFYADLPKGYQITQDRAPICIGGGLDIRVGDGEVKRVRIHHIHMEEDAGKSIHDAHDDHSLIDLNRAGTPLLEIVSEPDLRSAEEVDAYMSAMRRLARYLEISDGNMQEGSMRCDCNVSVRLKGETRLGQRCEIKNLNSMRYARRAIEFETRRQIDLLENGERVAQQTLNFDPATGATSPLRDKEDAHDYRYFPEPDLLPVTLSADYVQSIKANMPALPWEMYQELVTTYGLAENEAAILSEEKAAALFYKELCRFSSNNKTAANLLVQKYLPWCDENNRQPDEGPLSPEQLADFVRLIDEGKVAHAAAYQFIFPALIDQPQKTPLSIAQELNLIQNADSGFLDRLTDEVIADFPDKVTEYRSGKKGLLGFFMGEVMKRSKGKAEPKTTSGMLSKKLEG